MCPSPGASRTRHEVDHGIDGLASLEPLFRRPRRPPCSAIRPVELCQAPARFTLYSWLVFDRPSRPAVVDCHSQVAVGMRHADLDLALTAAEGVGDQFADDEFAEFGVLAKTPFE